MPDLKTDVRKHVRTLRLPPQRELEIIEELTLHLEGRFQDLLSDGYNRDEAYRLATSELLESGVLIRDLQKIESRVVREPVEPGTPGSSNLIADTWQDVRYGMRALRQSPGFTLLAVLLLAIGIGANSAIFGIVNSVLLRPLPYHAADGIMTLWQNNVKAGVARNDVSPANFLDWKQQSRSFGLMAGIEPFGFSMIGTGEPEQFRAWLVTAGFFEIMGSQALYGRTFTADEYQPGNNQVVVISYNLWQKRFGGDKNLLNQKLTLNGRPFTVVGIMPADFQFPPDRDIWAPRIIRDSDFQLRGPTYWNVVARLKPDVTQAQAQNELNGIAARLATQYPDTNGEMGVTVESLSELLTGKIKSALLLFLGAVGLVLLIACANVGNLLLMRGTARQREFAIRCALGASRVRVIRQLLIESFLLAVLSGGVGLVMASLALRLILYFNTAKIPRLDQVGIDFAVLVFTIVVATLTAIVFGLIPALEFSRPNLQAITQDGERGAVGPVRRRLRDALVVVEVAVAIVLLTGAGLLVRSFMNLLRVDPGFQKEHVLALQVFLPRGFKAEQATAFFDQSLEKIQQLPGVQAAAVVASPPFIDLETDVPFTVEGQTPPPKGNEPSAFYSEVSAGYLDAMGIPLRAGRFVSNEDRTPSAPVVVINETMARRYFPNQNPIGRQLNLILENQVKVEIVGVVGDVLHSGLDAQPRPELFVSYRQSPSTQMTFVVKTGPESEGMVNQIKAAIRTVNPNQTFARVAPMEQLVADSLRQRRFNLFLLVSFALVALGLAAVGIYGSINYSTQLRTREIGVRMALGAQAIDILRMIVLQGLTITFAGIIIGVVTAIMLTRLMSGLLFGVSASDPVTLVAISLLILLIALIASYVPAWRATKLDPLIALRYE